MTGRGRQKTTHTKLTSKTFRIFGRISNRISNECGCNDVGDFPFGFTTADITSWRDRVRSAVAKFRSTKSKLAVADPKSMLL